PLAKRTVDKPRPWTDCVSCILQKSIHATPLWTAYRSCHTKIVRGPKPARDAAGGAETKERIRLRSAQAGGAGREEGDARAQAWFRGAWLRGKELRRTQVRAARVPMTQDRL